MMGHPEKPDPYAERQPIPAYEAPAADEGDPSAFVVCVTVVALPVFALAFALGYMSGVWGWV